MINTVGIDERDLDIAPLGAMARLSCEPSAPHAPCSTSKVRVATTKTSRCPPSFKPPNSSNSPPQSDSATCRSQGPLPMALSNF